ncbi:MAG: 4-hydroxy-tetrahydrodipicolinate reductase [Dehalococcoidia bacterium]|nr:4-hydroxy-tetrahydrodipicolinate reductase [Dehalococcoidia bacterium]
MKNIGVVVNGALGRMGQEVTRAVAREAELKLVGAVDKEVFQQSLPLADVSYIVPLSDDIDSLLEQCAPDVLVDFTNAEVCLATARIAAKRHINLVIGTTGIAEESVAEIAEMCRTYKIGAMIAPNFSLGAALLIHLSQIAARFFDCAEILEMHHNRKIDAPSGTSIATAKAMLQAHGKPFTYPDLGEEVVRGTRGGQLGGIAIHSQRLPGFMAGQEVVFSEMGETLKLRHEAISRECYMPGVVLAIKEVVKHQELIYGLDALLALE